MNRRWALLAAVLPPHASVFACEICSAEQPSFLQNLTHGAGPQGNFDYVIVLAAVIVVAVTLAGSLKCLLRPGEGAPDHIKRTILEPD